MRLYVINSYNKKVYLNLKAPTRRRLATLIGSEDFYLGNEYYHVSMVRAELDGNNTAAGAVLGGLVGALGGPTGVVVGGLLGGLLGNTSEEDERKQVRRFNNS